MLKATFSSDAMLEGVDERARFLRWRDLYVEHIGSLDFTKYDDRRFSADLEFSRYDRVGLGAFRGTIHSVARTRHDMSADGRDEYCLMINGGGVTIAADYAGREAAIPPGGAILMSTNERGRLAARKPTAEEGDNVWRNIVVPGELLRAAIRVPDDRAGAAYGGPALAFLGGYLKLLSEQPPIANPRLAAHVGTTLVDLIGLVVGGAGEAEALGRGVRAVRTEACLASIARNYATPGFSAQTVARQLGVSARTVHDLLHATGVGFAERVLERRLQQARLLLTRPGADRLRIGDLALAVGFGDISYFNRCFRRRFGCAPRDLRAR